MSDGNPLAPAVPVFFKVYQPQVGFALVSKEKRNPPDLGGFCCVLYSRGDYLLSKQSPREWFWTFAASMGTKITGGFCA